MFSIVGIASVTAAPPSTPRKKVRRESVVLFLLVRIAGAFWSRALDVLLTKNLLARGISLRLLTCVHGCLREELPQALERVRIEGRRGQRRHQPSVRRRRLALRVHGALV